MVKLKGPGLAQQASGSIAEELTFSNWKKIAYLKMHRKPKQPRTKPQLALRAIMQFLSGEWNAIPQARKDTWIVPAAAKNIPLFNAYQAVNLTRWRNFHAPSQIYPATEIAPYAGYPTSFTYGGIRTVKHVITSGTQNDGWAFLIHHLDSAGDDRRWDNLAHVLPTPSPAIYTWLQQNLQAGTHYFMHTNFAIDGKMRNYSWLRTAVVTA